MAGEGVPPPRDVAPEVLWRSLLPVQPEIALRYRLPAAPAVPLRVRAVPALTIALAIDGAAGSDDDSSMVLRTIIAASLHTPQGLAFASEAEVSLLYTGEMAELATAVVDALDRICPRSGRSDRLSWEKRLLVGAKHPSNSMLVTALAECSDLVVAAKGPVWLPRPERYWGVPVRQLLDGHWLAFEAAMAAVGRT